MSDVDKSMQKFREGQMAGRIREATDEILDEEERMIINNVMRQLSAGETLDPQHAVQQWQRLYSVQRLKKVLARREREGQSAARSVGENLTSP